MGKRVVAWACLACLACLALLCGCGSAKEERETVKIAVSGSNFVQNMDTNYYKLWLEERSGLSIEFVLINETQAEEYLRLLFSSGNSDLDAVFFSPEWRLSSDNIRLYGEQGYILPLDDYADGGETNIGSLFDSFSDFDLRSAMAAPDGRLYYMPSLNMARLTRNRQALWMNTDWIRSLELSIPQTTDDLREVLRAFASKDPNENHVNDEIPLAGCVGTDAKQICNFLINSFVYYDPAVSGMAIAEGNVVFTPVTEEYRQALAYLNDLYREGLLPPLCFAFSEAQLTQLVNDPRNAVGGFSASSVTDVIYRDSADTLSNFLHVPPLTGPKGVRCALPSTSAPTPGGMITATCRNPDAVFRLMDLMLSEEASLIAGYGEQGVDWELAKVSDISITGGRAAINVKTRLENRVQNKLLAGMGPMVIREEYADSVSWSGMEADNEYIDSRAAVSYRRYEPDESIPLILFDTEDSEELTAIRGAVDAYTAQMLEAFVTGERDVRDSAQWQRYVEGYEGLQLHRLREAVQASWDLTKEWRETH